MLPRSGRAVDEGALTRALALADGWGAGTVAVAVLDADGVIAARGPLELALPWASVTKLVTAYTVLIGVERGVVGLDAPAGPKGATLRHLLAHASGYAFEGHGTLAAPGRTRIYSNTGLDEAAACLSTAAGRPFEVLLGEWVLTPLAMTGTRLVDRPSAGLTGPCEDLAAFARELLTPQLLPPDALRGATTVAFPGLRGVLPAFGLQDPCDWGLGFEIRGRKTPHWTGARNSERTFGHFGRSGTFLWVDPEAGLVVACLTDRDFGPWAAAAWPPFSDAILAAAGA